MQAVAETQLATETEAARLGREKGVRPTLDDEAVRPLGADLAAEARLALDQGDGVPRQQRREAMGRGQAGDAAPDDDDATTGDIDAHARRAPVAAVSAGSAGSQPASSARCRTSPARPASVAGWSLSISIRSRWTPRRSASWANSTSMSKRISTCSHTKPIGQIKTCR